MKYESLKLKNKIMKGEATRQNIQKQIVKVQNLHQKLKDRIYRCNCGCIEDRDYNASLNLRDAKIYKIA